MHNVSKTQVAPPKLAALDCSRIRAESGCDERTIRAYPNVGDTSRARIEAAADALDIVLPGRAVRIKATRQVGSIQLSPNAVRIRGVSTNASLDVDSGNRALEAALRCVSSPAEREAVRAAYHANTKKKK